MKFYIAVSTLLLIYCSATLAQGNLKADSVLFYKQGQIETEFATSSASQLIHSPYKKIGSAALTGNYTTGHYRLPQQAEYDGAAKFSTFGISTFSRFKTSGFFSYSRTWQDSLAWTTKGLEADAQPYYFASQKSGKYLRQKYQLGGVLSYALIEDRLFIGTGINYLYNHATRSVDPRPSVKTFNLALSPEISYRFKNSTLGIFYKKGYGNEYVGITYKNRDFATAGGENGAYPERINYLISSFTYDEAKQSGSESSLERDEKFLGWGGHYSINTKKWSIQNTLAYNLASEKSLYIKTTRLRDTLRVAEFQLENKQFTSLITHKGNVARRLIKLNVQLDDGDDFNYELGGRNYEYKNYTYSVHFLNLLWKYKKITPEYGISVTYVKNSKEDFGTEHYAAYEYLKLGLMAGIYTQNRRHNFSVAVSPSYRKSLKSQVREIPIDQLTAFTHGVVFPNQYYWATDAADITLNANYISKTLITQFPIGFSLQTNYQQRLNNPTSSNKTIDYAGKARTFITFSATIYL